MKMKKKNKNISANDFYQRAKLIKKINQAHIKNEREVIPDYFPSQSF